MSRLPAISFALGLASLSTLAACGSSVHPQPVPRPLTVDRYAARESNVNGYVIADGGGAVVLDATRTPEDGAALAALVEQRTSGPVTVLVTHGHPDHFLGLGALRAALPRARFVVASAEIKRDAIGMATWMTEQGWLAGLPAMQPRSDRQPQGFDYERELEVLEEPRLVLPGGGVLELTTDYPATEAEHMTTVYSPQLNALFTSDLAYKDVHLWLGIGVTKASARAWQAALDALTKRWADARPTVHPGHGGPAEVSLFAANRTYIDDILAVTEAATSDEAAIAQMVAKYPAHENRDFLLKMSVTNLRTLK